MDRRGFLFGLGASLVAAPAVVRAASLMPVRGIVMPVDWIDDDTPTLTMGCRTYRCLPNGSPLFEGDWYTLNIAGRERIFQIVAISPSPRPLADESV